MAFNKQAALAKLADLVVSRIPFNQVLGLKFESLEENRCSISFPMKEELVGNFVHGVLHGGVISAAMDMTGGTMAAIGVMKSNPLTHIQELYNKLSKLSTIDMRVDYLRPGKGEHFTVTATLLRGGSKLVVTRMELANEQDVVVAVGTATYYLG